MDASRGDWIIKGVKGEFYPCKPDIFAATYEPASQPAQPLTVRDTQCCMCGKLGLSTDEDGGTECELSDGRWVCSRGCYDRAVDGVSVQDAARVLLDAVNGGLDPLDACDPAIEALAVKHSGNRGDGVTQLEIAEEFFTAALRAIAEGRE